MIYTIFLKRTKEGFDKRTTVTGRYVGPSISLLSREYFILWRKNGAISSRYSRYYSSSQEDGRQTIKREEKGLAIIMISVPQSLQRLARGCWK
jgi:hypothetical protein